MCLCGEDPRFIEFFVALIIEFPFSVKMLDTICRAKINLQLKMMTIRTYVRFILLGSAYFIYCSVKAFRIKTIIQIFQV